MYTTIYRESTSNVGGGGGLEPCTASVTVNTTPHREWVSLRADGGGQCGKGTQKKKEGHSRSRSHR